MPSYIFVWGTNSIAADVRWKIDIELIECLSFINLYTTWDNLSLQVTYCNRQLAKGGVPPHNCRFRVFELVSFHTGSSGCFLLNAIHLHQFSTERTEPTHQFYTKQYFSVLFRKGFWGQNYFIFLRKHSMFTLLCIMALLCEWKKFSCHVFLWTDPVFWFILLVTFKMSWRRTGVVPISCLQCFLAAAHLVLQNWLTYRQQH